MTSRDAYTVVVLGAYGLAGREIVRGLLEKTSVRVVACGRDATRLAVLGAAGDPRRMQTRSLDVSDAVGLAQAVAGAQLVINCVGPYARHGADVARVLVDCGVSLMDLATEQVHYRRLQRLDAVARARGVAVLTGIGAIPGVSTVLMLLAAERLPDIEAIDAFLAHRRMPDGEGGLGSLLTAVLEAGCAPAMLRDGVYVPVRLGEDRRTEDMPVPVGPTQMIGLPTIDALVVPPRVGVRSLRTYFGIGNVFPGLFVLLRMLAPHRREWAYRLVRRLLATTMERERRQALAAEVSPECVVKVAARTRSGCWEGAAHFPDGAAATARLPVLAAKRCAEGTLAVAGLHTAADIFEPASVLEELAQMGWSVPLTERRA